MLALFHTHKHPSPWGGDTHLRPTEVPAPGRALSASIIPVDSEPPKFPHPTCHSFQGPDRRRDCCHHLRAAAGYCSAAGHPLLPLQVLSLPLPGHPRCSLGLARAPKAAPATCPSPSMKALAYSHPILCPHPLSFVRKSQPEALEYMQSCRDSEEAAPSPPQENPAATPAEAT